MSSSLKSCFEIVGQAIKTSPAAALFERPDIRTPYCIKMVEVAVHKTRYFDTRELKKAGSHQPSRQTSIILVTFLHYKGPTGPL